MRTPVPGLDVGVRRRTDRQGKRLIHQAIASPPGTERASYRTSTSTVPDGMAEGFDGPPRQLVAELARLDRQAGPGIEAGSEGARRQ
jgi:hypothetical protein